MSSRPSDAASIRSNLKIILIGSSGAGKNKLCKSMNKKYFSKRI